MIQRKSVIQTIKRAFQTGSLQLIGQQLKQIPKELLNLQTFDLGDQKWWDNNPITKLDFSNNQIEIIPQQIQKIVDVQVIRFKSNLLKTIPKQIYFQSLKLLDLSKNKLNTIPKQIYNAISLVQLNLSTNNLKECPNVSSINTLQVLFIDNNKIESLIPLPNNLKRLDASNNSITIIKQQYFSKSFSIQQIFLNKNSIKQLQQGSFMKCNKLITLQMKQNKLQKFQQVPFSDKLDTIALNYNRIKQFNKFQNCPNLTILILADNKLDKLSSDVILLKKLKTLDISNNDLSDLPSQLGLLPQLVRIQLDGNPLKSIRPNIKNSGVEILKKYLKDRIDPSKLEAIQKKTIQPKYIMNSNIDHWERLIMQFTTGNDLDLKNQNLTQLDPRVFKKTLRSLNLSKNNISKIGQQIQKCVQLKSLNLSQNSLQILPQSLLTLSTLQQLDIKRNKISQFFSKTSKCYLHNLFYLQLSVNKLSIIPAILTELPKLRILHLSYNKISNIQLLFDIRYFHLLETVDVSNNQIQQISDNIWNRSPSLNHFNIQNNNVSKLPTIIGFMKLSAFKVEGNPLKLIKRPTIMKGTVALLEDLRTKHVGNPPQSLVKQQSTYSDTNQNTFNEQQSHKYSRQQYNQVSNKQYNPQSQRFQQSYESNNSMKQQQPKYSEQQIRRRIKQIVTKITQFQNEIQNNFSLNKIQKTEKKRQIQKLMVERSQLNQLLQ